MMHEFTIEVTVQVDTDDPTRSQEALGRAAVAAIRHAVEEADANGFVHPLADETSIGVRDVLLQEGGQA